MGLLQFHTSLINLSFTNINKKGNALNKTHPMYIHGVLPVDRVNSGGGSRAQQTAGKSLSCRCNPNVEIPLPSSTAVVFYLRTQPSSTRSAAACTRTIQPTSPWPMSPWYPNLRTGRIIIAGKQTKCCQMHKVNTPNSCNLLFFFPCHISLHHNSNPLLA